MIYKINKKIDKKIFNKINNFIKIIKIKKKK